MMPYPILSGAASTHSAASKTETISVCFIIPRVFPGSIF